MFSTKRLQIFLFGCIIVILLSSCSLRSATHPTFWIEEPKAGAIVSQQGTEYTPGIYTNDLARLQQSVPFKIVLPKYLPPDIFGEPPGIFFESSYNSPGKFNLKITYYSKEVGKGIDIEESDTNRVMLPNEQLEHMYIEIRGIQILKQTLNYGLYGDEFTSIYTWNNKGVSFDVSVGAYKNQEAMKIIDSMIE